MMKIIFAAKVVLGIFMIMVEAYFLSSFESILDLILGATLMLAGVGSGVCLERRHSRIFILLSLPAFLLILLPYFFPVLSVLQYFPGGFLIYFACAVIFSGKKVVKTI